MNQGQHDELAQLFAQQMSFQANQPQPQHRQQSQHIQHVPAETEKQDQPTHFVSSHYTGTAHIRSSDIQSEPSRSPPPPYHEAALPEDLAQTLRNHSIDPSSLLPNQVHLFANAGYEQRLRLLEIWRISPPSYPLEQHLNSSWQPTSVEQEENDARVRYGQQQQQQSPPASAPAVQQVQSMHIAEEPMSPIREPGEAAWPPAARIRAASIASSRPVTRYGDAEPYMANGYQQSQQAVDPVYAAAAGLWQAPSYASAMSAMENQYGAYDHLRNHADWERMNEQVARQRFHGMGQVRVDEDMMIT